MPDIQESKKYWKIPLCSLGAAVAACYGISASYLSTFQQGSISSGRPIFPNSLFIATLGPLFISTVVGGISGAVIGTKMASSKDAAPSLDNCVKKILGGAAGAVVGASAGIGLGLLAEYAGIYTASFVNPHINMKR